jgi:hypothetical protein
MLFSSSKTHWVEEKIWVEAVKFNNDSRCEPYPENGSHWPAFEEFSHLDKGEMGWLLRGEYCSAW